MNHVHVYPHFYPILSIASSPKPKHRVMYCRHSSEDYVASESMRDGLIILAYENVLKHPAKLHALTN